jgi:hypothetical protein
MSRQRQNFVFHSPLNNYIEVPFLLDLFTINLIFCFASFTFILFGGVDETCLTTLFLTMSQLDII